ncbi:antibiotic biosynthesis monooxygenase [Frondihabitans sp. PAMC 28766]|uniref:antibiotic biosynthesis monooxygenase n=1 Tax=Frondihabitans sp. PAMC 28766 TaxID=1795630 RepID=UPI000B11D6B5
MSITRIVEPERIPEATRWVQAGVNLANRRPGFLGSGWVRAHADSDEWHMLYRFADDETLESWESSDERREWLATGQDLVVESRVEKRTGIEGWFDSAEKGAPAAPRRPGGSRRRASGSASFRSTWPSTSWPCWSSPASRTSRSC